MSRSTILASAVMTLLFLFWASAAFPIQPVFRKGQDIDLARLPEPISVVVSSQDHIYGFMATRSAIFYNSDGADMALRISKLPAASARMQKYFIVHFGTVPLGVDERLVGDEDWRWTVEWYEDEFENSEGDADVRLTVCVRYRFESVEALDNIDLPEDFEVVIHTPADSYRRRHNQRGNGLVQD